MTGGPTSPSPSMSSSSSLAALSSATRASGVAAGPSASTAAMARLRCEICCAGSASEKAGAALTGSLAQEGPEVQHARTGDATVAGTVLGHLRTLNAGDDPVGSFGAVVGATIGATEEDLDINGPFLVPGYGAQGGTVDDLGRIFGAAARWALPSSSREVLAAGPDRTALRDAARRGNDAVQGLGA